jgi:NAD(P)-dependent dehydrogenase (short-subunit alcohol dehydrogenase family)
MFRKLNFGVAFALFNHIFRELSPMKDFSLKAERVVVIGGSQGIGLAVAQAASVLGADVILASRSPDKLADAATTIPGYVETYPLDFTDEQQVADLFQNKVGSFDHLVITAFTFGGGPIADFPMAEARAVFEGKFWGAYQAIKYAVPYLSSRGSITMFSGNMVVRPPAGGLAAATAATGALEVLGRTLAVELGPIRVNVISPGVTDTPIWGGMGDATRNAMFDKARELLPVKRIAQPEDLAHAALALMTNPFITGVVLLVDGGEVLSMFPQPEMTKGINQLTHPLVDVK